MAFVPRSQTSPSSTRFQRLSTRQSVGCSTKTAFDPRRRRDCVVQAHLKHAIIELPDSIIGGSASSECAATSWVVHFPSHFHPVVDSNQDRTTRRPDDPTTQSSCSLHLWSQPCSACPLLPFNFSGLPGSRTESRSVPVHHHSLLPTRTRTRSETTPLLIRNTPAGRTLSPTPTLLLHHGNTPAIAQRR